MDAVRGYIGADCGMSLKAANGKYLSRIYRKERHAIEAAKDAKDPFTRFVPSEVNGKLVLKADNGKYLSRIHREGIDYLEARKDVPDVFCQFHVFSDDKGTIALRGDNDLFVSRILRDNDVHSIEVAKEGLDDECQFVLEVGDVGFPPKFEIVSVIWDDSATSVIDNPAVVTSETITNAGSHAVNEDLTLSWDGSTTHTTTWKHAWGAQAKLSIGAEIPLIAKAEFSIKLSYNGEYGTTSRVEHTNKFERKISVKAAAQKKTVFKLVVKKTDNIKLPFTAKIKCTTGDDTVTFLEEKGTWQGVAYHSANVEIEELPLDKP